MSWLRIEDTYAEHPKIVGLSDQAFRLHVSLLCYCARHLTDGAVDNSGMRAVCASIGHRFTSRSKCVSELIRHRLLTLSGDTYTVNDYLTYNPNAASVKAKRERNAERQARFRESRNAVTNAAPSQPIPFPSHKDQLRVREIVDKSLSTGTGAA